MKQREIMGALAEAARLAAALRAKRRELNATIREVERRRDELAEVASGRAATARAGRRNGQTALKAMGARKGGKA